MMNSSGGLPSKGHPLGVTGIAQIDEIVWAIKGRSGRQTSKRS